jgi:hypothetical protein
MAEHSFNPKREEITGVYQEVHNIYFPSGVLNWFRMRWAGHTERIDAVTNLYKMLLGKSEWNRMKMTVFWDAVPCSLVEVYRRFRGAYCLHHRPDGGSKHLWNVGKLTDYTAQHPSRQSPSYLPLWELEISLEWKRPFGGPGHRWEGNIKMDINPLKPKRERESSEGQQKSRSKVNILGEKWETLYFWRGEGASYS